MRDLIEKAWEDRSLLQNSDSQDAIREVIDQLDRGMLRVAEPTDKGWQVNEWVKKAVVLYFPIQKMETIELGPLEWHDKMKLKVIMPAWVFEWCLTQLHDTVHIWLLV